MFTSTLDSLQNPLVTDYVWCISFVQRRFTAKLWLFRITGTLFWKYLCGIAVETMTEWISTHLHCFEWRQFSQRMMFQSLGRWNQTIWGLDTTKWMPWSDSCSSRTQQSGFYSDMWAWALFCSSDDLTLKLQAAGPAGSNVIFSWSSIRV